jgi:integrase
MAIVQQCPICKARQKNSNKKCGRCGEDLVKAKKSNRVKYWISYWLDGKTRYKSIGYSISEAQDADSKVKVEKRENPFFQKTDNEVTFKGLAEWYTGLISIQEKKYFPTLTIRLSRWNEVYGNKKIIDLKKSDVENFQSKKRKEGAAGSTIDQEVGAARTMVQAAIDDDRVSGDCIKPFRKVNKVLKGASNARDRIIHIEQLFGILEHLPEHLHGIVSLGFFAGMREGEILGLTWEKINLQNEHPHIKLSSEDTKEGKVKIIPLAGKVQGNPLGILKSIPKALHTNRVFLNGGRLVDKKHLHRYLAKACKSVGIPYGRFEKDGFIFHDLRHCFNTYMRRAGVDQFTIMTIMGHSPGRGMEMTYRYSSFELSDMGNAIGKMENYFIGTSCQTSTKTST